MPYCPKCDMEFVDGITTCTDCGGPLVESEAVAKAMKAEERAHERAREKAMYEEYLRSTQESNPDEEGNATENFSTDGADAAASPSAGEESRRISSRPQSILPPEPTYVYVDKSQKYSDLKSSAGAFLAVGLVLFAGFILSMTGIIKLPMASTPGIIFHGVILVLSVCCLLVFLNTTRQAKKLKPEIEAEKTRTADIIRWFLDTWTAEAIDEEIKKQQPLARKKLSEEEPSETGLSETELPENGLPETGLSEEELSLKRFQLIQDYLITGQDLPDQSYVDALSEEIYGKLFENRE